MSWQTLRQLKGQSVQIYTREFHKRALTLGISLDSPETLLKYIGGLPSYLKHTILMFNLTSLDDGSVQATHLEARGKNVSHDVGKSSESTELFQIVFHFYIVVNLIWLSTIQKPQGLQTFKSNL